MFYADNYCQIEEVYAPEHKYVVKGKCKITGNPVVVCIPAKEMYAYRQGKLIQDAMPSLTTDEREFLISGLSKEGWDKTFGTDEVNSLL